MNKLFIIKMPTADKAEPDDTTYWITMGRAFVNQDDDGNIRNIGIELDAVPLSGNLRAFPARSSSDSPNARTLNPTAA